jgi:hypothetical protein
MLTGTLITHSVSYLVQSLDVIEGLFIPVYLILPILVILLVPSAKYEFASSNTTRPTFAFDACFVWILAPLADERSGFFIENPSRRLTRSSTY